MNVCAISKSRSDRLYCIVNAYPGCYITLSPVALLQIKELVNVLDGYLRVSSVSRLPYKLRQGRLGDGWGAIFSSVNSTLKFTELKTAGSRAF